MKRLLLLLVLFTTACFTYAQACLPDSIFQDSSAGAYPLPLNEGVGGLDAFPACINEPYELTFTIKLTDSINFGGIGVDIIDVQIPTTGGVTGLPEGVNYFCNPPDCIFPDTVLGCVVLRGTPTENNTPGEYELLITGTANLGIIGEIGVSFPGALAAGSYIVTLNEEGGCDTSMTTSVNYLSENISLGNRPNPVQLQTQIEMTSLIEGDFQFTIFDNAGRVVHTRGVNLNVGYNTFPFDASNLVDGIYFYSLSDGNTMIYEKMMVGR